MTQAQATSSISAAIPRRRAGRVAVGLLACFLGWAGAHWWYLGRRHAWAVSLYAALALAGAFSLYPVWYDNPAFFLLFIPMIDGFVESVVFSLMSDEKFDRRYNPDLGRPSATGWGPVLVALSACLIGSIVAMFAIAMVVVYVWVAMGWLDGYVL
ncbi:hypothetical protein WJ970_35680 [Achromobacter xylosoxidans]